MQKPNINISVKFVATNPNNIIITDSTNYTALSLDQTKVKINVKVTTPTGVIYVPAYYNIPNVTNDFTPLVPFDYIIKQGVLAIPNFLLDSKGCFINGKYKVDIKWYYVDTAETFDYVFEQDIQFKKVDFKIEQTADCFCAIFESIDKTNYNGSTEVSYQHIVNYPSNTNEADLITTLKSYKDNRLANGTYITEVYTERVMPFGAVFSVQDMFYGKKSFIVDCSSICYIKCGINNIYKAYKDSCGTDKAESERLLKILNKVTLLYTLLYMNNSCGSTTDSSSYLTELKAIIGDCDCKCNDKVESVWVSSVCDSSGGSSFDPTPINNYINSINIALINLINNQQLQINGLLVLINQLQNENWFTGLNTACLPSFPLLGTELQQKQYLIDTLCSIITQISQPPVAKQDFSTTLVDVSVEKLVTLNDFATTNVTVSITTPPINGTVVVLADGKTLKYTPNLGYIGNENIGYTITDANGLTSNSIWSIVVNPVAGASCSVVFPVYNASLYSVGAFLQISIANQTDYGTNIPTQEDYLIEIRDSSNLTLYTYLVNGSLSTDPTVFTTPTPIVSNWDNVRIQLLTNSEDADGDPCGLVVYESPTAFTLTNISISWFDGTTIPACLGILGTDDEIVKKNKLMNTICMAYNLSVQNEDYINNLSAVNGLNGNGSTLTPFKLGGDLIEDTTIDGLSNESITFKDYKKLNYLVNSIELNALNSLKEERVRIEKGNLPIGFINKICVYILDILNFNLGGSSHLANTVEQFYINLKESITTLKMPNSCSPVNKDIAMLINSDGGDYTFSPQQASGLNPRRNLINTRITTHLSPDNLVNKATISHYANLEISNGSNGVFFNKWLDFIQLYIRNARGGSITASLVDMPLTYGIYQEATTDINALFGTTIIGGNAVSPLQPTAKLHVIGLATKSAGTTWVVPSDRRLKEDIKDYKDGLRKLIKIQPKTFKYNGNLGTEKSEDDVVGIIADEIVEILPYTISKQKIDGEEEPYMSFDANALVFLCINSIKELNEEVQKLKKEIALLKTPNKTK